MSAPTTTLQHLQDTAEAADRLYAQSRQMLVDAVRAGMRAGLSQRDIAAAVGRSQPEVSRLLKFHGTSPLGRILRSHRSDVIKIAKAHGARDLKVFGSVSLGTDTADSDVDLLATFDPGVDLFDMARLELALSEVLGVDVDVVPEKSLREFIKDRVLDQAVPL